MEHGDDVSYFDIHKPKEEKIWCQIGDDGGLAFVDWDIVKDLAEKFDTSRPEDRNEQMLIAKLMVLVRKQTIEECANGIPIR